MASNILFANCFHIILTIFIFFSSIVSKVGGIVSTAISRMSHNAQKKREELEEKKKEEILGEEGTSEDLKGASKALDTWISNSKREKAA